MADTVGHQEPHHVDRHVGERIRRRRRALGLSQDDLASSVGLTFQQIQKYERGANRVSASKLYQIAQALSAPVRYFFEGLVDPTRSGQGEDSDAALTVDELPLTPEEHDLVASFRRVDSRRMRRQLVSLVNMIVEEGAALSAQTPDLEEATSD